MIVTLSHPATRRRIQVDSRHVHNYVDQGWQPVAEPKPAKKATPRKRATKKASAKKG